MLSKERAAEGFHSVARLFAVVGDHVDNPNKVIPRIETDRVLLVGALVAAGCDVFAINPLSVDRY